MKDQHTLVFVCVSALPSNRTVADFLSLISVYHTPCEGVRRICPPKLPEIKYACYSSLLSLLTNYQYVSVKPWLVYSMPHWFATFSAKFLFTHIWNREMRNSFNVSYCELILINVLSVELIVAVCHGLSSWPSCNTDDFWNRSSL